LVIWQGPICEELHGVGLDLSENGSAETTTDEGRREIGTRLPDSRVS